jgi:hypothetical protein
MLYFVVLQLCPSGVFHHWVNLFFSFDEGLFFCFNSKPCAITISLMLFTIARLRRSLISTKSDGENGASLVNDAYPGKYCINAFSCIYKNVTLSVRLNICLMITVPGTSLPLMGGQPSLL